MTMMTSALTNVLSGTADDTGSKKTGNKRGRKRKNEQSAATGKKRQRTVASSRHVWDILPLDCSEFVQGGTVGLVQEGKEPIAIGMVHGAVPDPLDSSINMSQLSKQQVMSLIAEKKIAPKHVGTLCQIRQGKATTDGVFVKFVWSKDTGKVYHLQPKEAKKILGCKPSTHFRKELACNNRLPNGQPMYEVDEEFWDKFHLDKSVNVVQDAAQRGAAANTGKNIAPAAEAKHPSLATPVLAQLNNMIRVELPRLLDLLAAEPRSSQPPDEDLQEDSDD